MDTRENPNVNSLIDSRDPWTMTDILFLRRGKSAVS